MRQRSFYDADNIEEKLKPSLRRTAENAYEVICGVCGDKYFVDKAQAKHIEEAIEANAENTFVCEACENEYEELSHPG